MVRRKTFEEQLQFIQNNPYPISLLLDGISNARNLGAIFRIADAARIKKIYTYKMAATGKGKKLLRFSRSTYRFVPSKAVSSPEEVASLKQNRQLVALEITANSIPYTDFKSGRETILIIGNEKKGISEELLQLADSCIHIPMHGINSSMNVSVATGIAVFSMLEKMNIGLD